MAVELVFHSDMATLFGAKHSLKNVTTIHDAMQFMAVNFASFKQWVRERNFEVLVNGKLVKSDNLTTQYPNAIIEIIPAIVGAGRGLMQFIAGVALMGLSFIMPFAAVATFKLGAGLALSGIAAMISPAVEDSEDGSKGGQFTGPITRDARGQSVRVGIGEAHVGLLLISSKITTKEV